MLFPRVCFAQKKKKKKKTSVILRIPDMRKNRRKYWINSHSGSGTDGGFTPKQRLKPIRWLWTSLIGSDIGVLLCYSNSPARAIRPWKEISVQPMRTDGAYVSKMTLVRQLCGLLNISLSPKWVSMFVSLLPRHVPPFLPSPLLLCRPLSLIQMPG